MRDFLRARSYFEETNRRGEFPRVLLAGPSKIFFSRKLQASSLKESPGLAESAHEFALKNCDWLKFDFVKNFFGFNGNLNFKISQTDNNLQN